MNLSSGVFENGGVIPAKYTCDGDQTSLPLHWNGVPTEAKSLALIMDDPDALPVANKIWDHWILFNMPAQDGSLAEGERPTHGVVGSNGSGKAEYQGPCPPNGEHAYRFRLYALDTMLDLAEGAPKEAVEKALSGHILAESHLEGRYTRTSR